MNDYCNGIGYATGCLVTEDEKKYLMIRNLDKWYAESIAKETGYHIYKSVYNSNRDGKEQWVVKARNITALPLLEKIENKADFCRAFIEIHGILDKCNVKGRKGRVYSRLRLRIYGKEQYLQFINDILPAREKKIQHIRNVVDEKYVGETCGLSYCSKVEIHDILDWISGEPKNISVWSKWEKIISI